MCVRVCVCWLLGFIIYTFSNGGYIGASQGALVVKNSSANAREIRDTGSIPRSGRSLGEGNGYPLQDSLPGESPWTEEPGGLQSMRSQRVGHS